jgi:hypothetical protein
MHTITAHAESQGHTIFLRNSFGNILNHTKNPNLIQEYVIISGAILFQVNNSRVHDTAKFDFSHVI